MEPWLATIISLVGSTIISTVVSVIIKRGLDKGFKNQKELMELREERSRAERKKELSEDITKQLKPLENKIDNLASKLDKVEDGTLSTLRNDILTCYYRCLDKGYRNDYDYQNIHHMYDSYLELNGNSYVADVVKRFDEDLPNKEEFAKKNKKNIKNKKEED